MNDFKKNLVEIKDYLKSLKMFDKIILIGILVLIISLPFLLKSNKKKDKEIITPFIKEIIINDSEEKTNIQLPGFGYNTSIEKYPELMWYDVNLKQDKPYVFVNVVYPQFVGSDSIEKLNQHISSVIKKELDDSLYDFNSYVLPSIGGFGEGQGLNFSVQYRIMGVVNNVISIEFITTDYTGGGNGNHDYPLVINWDLKSNKPLKNDELFCSKDYTLTLMPLVHKEILSRYDNSNEYYVKSVENGVKNEKGDWGFFTLTKDGLMVIFPPYQIFSGSMGMVYSLIPYTDIPNLLCLP